MDKFVSINVFNGGKLINKNLVPLLFYWDGTSDIKESLINNNTFYEFLKNNIINKECYGDSVIAYFYFIYNDDTYEEVYNDCTQLFQSWLPIKEIPSLIEDLISTHFNYLYNCSYKEDYNFTGEFERDILDIYDLIKTKYPSKIAKNTVVNYVRSELNSTNHLNTDNSDYVISILEKILINKE